MKWFNNLKVAYKVLISCMVLILLMVAVIFFSMSSMKSAQEAVRDYRENSVLAIINMDSIMKNLLQARINMFAASLALSEGNTGEVKKRLDDIGKLREKNVKLLEEIRNRGMSVEEKTLTQKYVSVYMDLGKRMNEWDAALKNNDSIQIKASMDAWYQQFLSVETGLDELHAETIKKGAGKIVAEFEAMERVILYLFGILGASLLIGIIITIVLSRSVSKPVGLGLAFAQKLADGDLTERIELEQDDELGKLAKALNAAGDNLERLISDVEESVQNLTLAVNDISTGNQSLSQRTSEQASSLEEIASTLEEATASIRMNSDNTVEANKIALNSTSLAEDGGKIVESTVTSINQISDSGKKIGEIIAVINEIAFQTNLLALNAAVEAARAGDQGRGFAVVASEVRNLAQRAGNSAKEIEALIKDSQDKINQGTEYVSRSGESLGEIIASVKEVGRIISEVTASTEEQKQGMGQINTAVMELDTMTQQNAALVEETASASEEMAGQAQELLAMMKRFKISTDEKGLARTKKYETARKTKVSAKPKAEVKPGNKEEISMQSKEAEQKNVSNEKSDEKIFEEDGFEKF
ncbi:MAG TPA: methyl-accepting chemotaxis protein [Spirochaetota bacterium]|nr:methyl-accepting chemotaxis protein [Spirochaetota bacterium]HPJ34711.1 methyl-accepting chemotaxis protein [Spirochaetota bacterium]